MTRDSQPTLCDRVLTAYYRRNWRGFHPLMRLGRKHHLRSRATTGAVLDLKPWEYIDGIVLRAGFYEPEVFDALRPFLTDGAVLWDIGANIGLHAISAALHTPGARVIAFEPASTTRQRLQGHAILNQVGVEVHALALGEEDRDATLYENQDGNAGMSSLMHAATGPATTVRMARGDTLIASGSVPPPTVIKIDVEGAEEFALRGLGGWLSSPTLRAVVYETTAQLLDDPTQCAATRALLAAGFKITALPRSASQAHLLANFLALRP